VLVPVKTASLSLEFASTAAMISPTPCAQLRRSIAVLLWMVPSSVCRHCCCRSRLCAALFDCSARFRSASSHCLKHGGEASWHNLRTHGSEHSSRLRRFDTSIRSSEQVVRIECSVEEQLWGGITRDVGRRCVIRARQTTRLHFSLISCPIETRPSDTARACSSNFKHEFSS
jgi:hypothetical protein